MSNPLKIGIVGAGALGTMHARRVRECGGRIVAIHDANPASAQKLATEFSDAKATNSLAIFFETPMDGLILATPPPVRIEPITLACERGIHLMIEKPPAINLREAKICLDAIQSSGVMAAVGFQLRYEPRYERLKELLVGQTVHLARTVCTIDYYLNFHMSPWFLQSKISGGPIAEQAIHLLDCVRYVLGDAKPTQAHALAIKNMAFDRPEFDAENAIQMTYQLDNGVFATHMNHCGTERFAFDLEVVGPHLRLIANITDSHIRGYLNGKDINESIPSQNSIGHDKISAWLAAITTGDRSLIRSTFEESLNTLALVEAAIESRQTGRFVQVTELQS